MQIDCENRNIFKIMVHELILEGRIMAFKSLTVFTVIHPLLINKRHNNTIDLLCKIQKNVIWQRKKAKIKHSTHCNGFEKGGSKNVALRHKITSMQ